jgi:large subunit ribosomal protein L10
LLTRVQKQEKVVELHEKLGRATSVYLADYRGVTVESVNRLRGRIRREGQGDYEYEVVKNTLLERAARETEAEALVDHFEGPTVLALSYGDPIGLAKILVDFAKDVEVFQLKAGVLAGRKLGVGEIGQLATLPPLDEIRATLIGLIQAPATKLARLASEPGAQLARALAARGRQEGS